MDQVDEKVKKTFKAVQERVLSSLDQVDSNVAATLECVDKRVLQSMNSMNIKRDEINNSTFDSLLKGFEHSGNKYSEFSTHDQRSLLFDRSPETLPTTYSFQVDPNSFQLPHNNGVISDNEMHFNDINNANEVKNFNLDSFLQKHTMPESSKQDQDQNSVFKDYTLIRNNTSIISQQGQISIPLVRPLIQDKIRNLLKHVVFENPSLDVDYLDLYKGGLLSGELQNLDLNLNAITSREDYFCKSLHPILKEVFLLDNTLLLDLVLDWEPPTTKKLLSAESKDEKFLKFVAGLVSFTRHLYPLSENLQKMSLKLNQQLSCAQAMILVRDKISIIKLLVNSSRTGLIDHQDSTKSKISASISQLNMAIIDWISIL